MRSWGGCPPIHEPTDPHLHSYRSIPVRNPFKSPVCERQQRVRTSTPTTQVLRQSLLLRDIELASDTGIPVHDHYAWQSLHWHNKRLSEPRLAIRKRILNPISDGLPRHLQHAECPQILRYSLLGPVSNKTVGLQQKCGLLK